VSTVLEVARPECAVDVLSDEVVALNVATGVYFSMRGLAAALWHDLAAGHPVEALVEQARRVGGSGERVAGFAEQVQRHGLMRVSSAPPTADADLASAQLLAGEPESLVFEVYEDMRDLILSDPIHDVDEQSGWPRKAEGA
jgi:hypothetical protein